MQKTIISLMMLISFYSISYSQISYGGTPPSFEFEPTLRTTIEPYQVNISDFDFKEMVRQDEIAEENGSPMRVAIALPAEVDIQKTGEWATLPNSQKIWRQTIGSYRS